MHNLRQMLLPAHSITAHLRAQRTEAAVPDALPISRKDFRRLAFAHCRLCRAAKQAGIDPLHYVHSLNSLSVKKGKANPLFIGYERRAEEFERTVSRVCISDSTAHLPRDIKLAALQAYKAFPAAKGYWHEAHLVQNMPTATEDARFLSSMILRSRTRKIIMAFSAPLLALSTFLQYTLGHNTALIVLGAASLFGAAWSIGGIIYSGLDLKDIRKRYSKRIFDAAASALDGAGASGHQNGPAEKHAGTPNSIHTGARPGEQL